MILAITGSTTVIAMSVGTAHAGLDDELSLVDGQGRTMTVQQWDTFLDGVVPLDRNRLSREWFQSGRALYRVAGPGAETFAGVLELGYQVGFPWAMGVGVNFTYRSPNVTLGGWGLDDNLTDRVYTPPLFPSVAISADLGNGPGVLEVATFSVDVAGPAGSVVVSGAHGAVTGAAGGVLLRPFARLISSTGDSVTTYGRSWTMN
ncbi:MAG: MspA family porin [Actinomycetota bacterium]|nr:MspA family porin [Actinomycetota bacterium]